MSSLKQNSHISNNECTVEEEASLSSSSRSLNSTKKHQNSKTETEGVPSGSISGLGSFQNSKYPKLTKGLTTDVQMVI